jgi:putative flippase GtrA
MKYLRARIPNSLLINQFLRFFFIGGFCASLNILILYILTGILNLHYSFSILIQTLVVNSIGFYLNKKFTFKKNKDSFWREFLKYHTVMFSSFLLVLLLMFLFVDIFHVWYLFSFFIVSVIMISYNFISHKKWTFKK